MRSTSNTLGLCIIGTRKSISNLIKGWLKSSTILMSIKMSLGTAVGSGQNPGRWTLRGSKPLIYRRLAGISRLRLDKGDRTPTVYLAGFLPVVLLISEGTTVNARDGP